MYENSNDLASQVEESFVKIQVELVNTVSQLLERPNLTFTEQTTILTSMETFTLPLTTNNNTYDFFLFWCGSYFFLDFDFLGHVESVAFF